MTTWGLLTILPHGRTARADYIPCEPMSFSELQTRSLVWTCLVFVTLVTSFGQSLHQFAGIRHACVCGTSASDGARHSCGDVSCAFSESDRNHSDDDEERRSTSPDGCAVCRLLAHLRAGFFRIPAELSQLQVVAREAAPQSDAVTIVSCFSYSPRGPPCIL